MKPLKITMNAFGAYADLQEIDFTLLGTAGLYLITGETGAGKTTIFDAISFALYGKASGTNRENYLMLRSDFAAEKTKTYVELDFISGDKQYNIKRIIKKSGQEAALLLPDGTVISGGRNLKEKITEIIGLDQDQFSQIVMIAQNDFLRFLQSGTDERVKIMRRIFNTEALRLFQEHLKHLVKIESDKRDFILHDFARYDVDIYKRNEQFQEWEAQIKTDKAGFSDMDEKISKCDAKKQALAAELALAEELLRKFDTLAKYRKDFALHEEKAHEIDEITGRFSRGETALYKIKPLYDETQKALKNHATAENDLTKAKNLENDAFARAQEVVKVIAALPPLAEAQETFAVLAKEWEAADADLRHLRDLHGRHHEITEKQSDLTAKQDELDQTLHSLSELPLLNDCQSELDKIKEDLKDNDEKLLKLTAAQKDYTHILKKQKELLMEQMGFETLDTSFRKEDAAYRALEEAFLLNQAGIIAQGLEVGSPCPVCGSAEHPAPAELSAQNITEGMLKKAREAKDKLQTKREKQSSLCGALGTEIETLTKRFISDASSFIAAAAFSEAETILAAGISSTKSKGRELSQKKSAAEESLAGLKEKSERLIKQRDLLTPEAATLKGEIATLTKRFLSDFAVFVKNADLGSSAAKLKKLLAKTKDWAEKLSERKEKAEKSLALLSSNWDDAIKRKASTEAEVQSAQTLVTERSANEQRLKKLRDETQASYTDALKANHFINEADFKAVLIDETMLTAYKKQVSDYKNHGEQLKRDISRLEKETAEKVKPDIDSLRSEQENVTREAKALSEQRDEIKSRLSRIESMLKELRRAALDFEKVELKYAAVKQLANAANGKLDFETYAQMAYFERVLRAANLRLKVMSQNRYTLLRKTVSDDGRKRAGLELEVLDAYTGKARSANSLSGGESFMTSLSLALGLSDVVQHSAGGIRLDSMFIDEGFGSLDNDVLELAIRTLSEMAGANRIIGIVSHVSELRERIDKQVQVEKTAGGSVVRLKV